MHTLSQRATDAYEAARHALARFAGAGRGHEVVFTSGTTESLNLVAHGLSDAGIGPAWLRPGDEIVVSALEHHANLVPWQAAARRSGARLKVLLPDAQGRVDEAGLARLLGPRTRVFALTACANATGYCPPYAELLALAARAGALTVLDAAQSASHALPAIDKLACDFMAFQATRCTARWGSAFWSAGATRATSSRRCPRGSKAERPTSAARSASLRRRTSSTASAAT